MKKFKRRRVWFGEILIWAIRGICAAFPYLILMIILCSLYFYQDHITGCKERDIRTIGLFLQVLGFMAVAWQLRNLHKLFRKPLFFSQLASYWRKFPSSYIKNLSIGGQITGGAATLEARLSVRPSPNATLEQRIELLEKQLESVENNFHDLEKTLNVHKEESKKSLDKVSEEIRDSVKKVKR